MITSRTIKRGMIYSRKMRLVAALLAVLSAGICVAQSARPEGAMPPDPQIVVALRQISAQRI